MSERAVREARLRRINADMDYLTGRTQELLARGERLPRFVDHSLIGTKEIQMSETPTMLQAQCQCPNDCDCDGRFACEAHPTGPGIKGSWTCELVAGHDGWHQSGGHRWPVSDARVPSTSEGEGA